jgi:hypothetical protein
LSQWVSKNYFIIAYYQFYKIFDPKLESGEIEIVLYRLGFRKTLSNTHCAPYGRVTNFMCQHDKPNGYPGWLGKITIKCVKGKTMPYDYRNFETRVLASVAIYTGSGGGSNENLTYDLTLWCDDWPGLTTALLMEKLSAE